MSYRRSLKELYHNATASISKRDLPINSLPMWFNSTQDVETYFTDCIPRRGLDGGLTGAMVVDLLKAFDCSLNHELLLKKMAGYAITTMNCNGSRTIFRIVINLLSMAFYCLPLSRSRQASHKRVDFRISKQVHHYK